MPFISVDSLLWWEMLEESDYDLYHLPGYVSLDASLIGGEAMAWYYERDGMKCLMPLIRRAVPEMYKRDGLYDVVSPYGYPGILFNRELEVVEAAKVIDAYRKEAMDEGLVSGFVRLNPFKNEWDIGVLGCEAVSIGCTVAVNLEDFEKGSFRENHRRDLRQLHEGGYSATVNEWNYLPEFIEAYYETMCRRQAMPYYFFPEWYFSKLREMADEHLIFVSVMSPEGKYVSGGLYTHFHGIMQFHLGGTCYDRLGLSASKMVMEKAIEIGRQLNAKWLNLGGGVGADSSDGLYKFKQGFASHKLPFTCLQFIHNYDYYRALCSKLENRVEEVFFPGYRK